MYIMASISRVVYVGMTNNLERRIQEHKHGTIAGFASKYRTTKLVYYEMFGSPHDAIACEKKVKGWLRAKKIALIKAANPMWRDLSRESGAPKDSSRSLL